MNKYGQKHALNRAKSDTRWKYSLLFGQMAN